MKPASYRESNPAFRFSTTGKQMVDFLACRRSSAVKINYTYMKKILGLIVLVFPGTLVFAGGLVTNTNQSAAWVRMPSQNATTSIAAVYFNPAGVMRLNNGFHVSFSNQIISQTREVTNDYPALNTATYEGSVFAPLFPSVYAVYKRNKIAFSFGFNPVGGGGSAVYDKGLPSFEMKPSDLVAALNPTALPTGVTDYRLNTSFEGSSVNYGFQGGVSWNASETVALFAGLRYISAKNTYNGYLKDIEVFNFGNSNAWTRAETVLAGISANAYNGAAYLTGLGLPGGNPLTDATAIAALQQLGINPTGFTNQVAIAAFNSAGKKYLNSSVLLRDQEADVEETGHGLTPIIGVNIAASEKINIGMKIEFQTLMELQRSTSKDVQIGFLSPGDTIPETMFPDGRKFRSDMPAIVSGGISYQLLSKLKLSASGNYYFDRAEKMFYGKTINREYVRNISVIDKNSWEAAGGLEYSISDKLLVSGGALVSKNFVNSYYQSDASYSLNSVTYNLGLAYRLNDKINVDLGFGYTSYDERYKAVKYQISQTTILYPIETYNKTNMFGGIGIEFSF
jgi:long-subunit fatty acid transport protein